MQDQLAVAPIPVAQAGLLPALRMVKGNDMSVVDFHAYPYASGHFGRYGGRFVAET